MTLPSLENFHRPESEEHLHDCSAQFVRNACALAQCQGKLLALWDAHHKRRANALRHHLNAALPEVAVDPLGIVAAYAPDVVGND